MILMCRALWRDLGLVEGRRRPARAQSASASPTSAAPTAPRWSPTSRQHADALDADARRRLHSNPLRILDSKNPAMQAIVDGAPQLMRFPRRRHRWRTSPRVRAALRRRRARLPRQPAPGARPRTTTTSRVFEWVTDHLGVARHGLRRRPLRRLVSSSSAASRRRRSAGAWASSAMPLLLEAARRADAGAARVDVYAVVPRPAGAAGALAVAASAARAAACRCRCTPPARRLGQHEGRSSSAPTPAAPAMRWSSRRRRAGPRRSRASKALRDAAARSSVLRAPADLGHVGPHPHRIIPALPRRSPRHGHPISTSEEQEQLDQLKAFWNSVRQPDHLAC